MAVNYTGNGGVPKGTVYAASRTGTDFRVAMFVPDAEKGLKFAEEWLVTTEGGAYERCGPLLGTEEKEGKEVAKFPLPAAGESSPAGSGRRRRRRGDRQRLCLRGDSKLFPGRKEIVEYSADGGKEITRFGEQAPEGQTVAESPAKIHGSGLPGGDRGERGRGRLRLRRNADSH